MTSMAKKSEFRITGRMVLFGMIAFYAVIMAVNGVFMFFALNTWPGLTDGNAYKNGLAYNRTLADGERQSLLGWKTQARIDGETLSIVLAGKDGSPMNDATITANAARPVGEAHATPLIFAPVGDGVYTTRFAAPLAGRWKVDLHIRAGNDNFRAVHEVMVEK